MQVHMYDGVPDNIHVTIGWIRQVFYCRPGVNFLSPDFY